MFFNHVERCSTFCLVAASRESFDIQDLPLVRQWLRDVNAVRRPVMAIDFMLCSEM